MAIFALAVNLKDDPRLIEDYLEHHRHVWPEVLEAIRATGIEDIKIYLSGRRLFMVMVGPEGFDPAQAFAEYRREPMVVRWETLMQSMQERLPDASGGQWWMPLPPIFDLSEAAPSGKATADVKSDRLASFGLEGRVALVTGAAGGIGSAIVGLLSDMGVAVVATDADADGLARLPPSHGGPPITADIGERGACGSLVAAVIERHRRLDILVNNAAVMIRKDIDDFDDDDWDRIFDVNLRSQFLLARAAAKSMKQMGWGRIVNLAASNVYNGGLYQSSLYAIAKGATLTLTRSFASRLAPFGICVNTVAPGPVDTPMFRHKLSEADLEAFPRMIPMRRIAKPLEIARLIAFLSSDWCSYITGQVIDINGGQVMR